MDVAGLGVVMCSAPLNCLHYILGDFLYVRYSVRYKYKIFSGQEEIVPMDSPEVLSVCSCGRPMM